MNAGGSRERAAALARALGVGRAARHVFVCSGPRCASAEDAARVWRRLKQRLKQEGLTPPPLGKGDPGASSAPNGPVVLRSKVDCLRICEQGPLLLVYPEGVWYRGVTEEIVDRIVDEHLKQGRLVEEHVFAVAPLGIAGPEREGGR